MLSVTNKPLMLGVVMLRAVILSVVAPHSDKQIMSQGKHKNCAYMWTYKLKILIFYGSKMAALLK
jgi:hypothetical protein